MVLCGGVRRIVYSFYVWNIALAALFASPDPGVAATNMLLVSLSTL